MSEELLKEYISHVWTKIKEAPPPQKGNRIMESVAIRLGFNKANRKLVGKAYWKHGSLVYTPKKNINLLKNSIAQVPIGTLSMERYRYLKKELDGKDLPFTNFVFDEIVGMAPGGKILENILKYTKLGNAVLSTPPASLQVRNGDMLFAHQIIGKKRGTLFEFEYIEYLMLVDPYRKGQNDSSWILRERRSPLEIFEIPDSYKSRIYRIDRKKNTEIYDPFRKPRWLEKKSFLR